MWSRKSEKGEVKMIRKIKNRLFPEKHEITIIYEDRVFHHRMKYPKDAQFKDERGNTYYLDPKRTTHVFIGGYANEIDGAKVGRDGKRYEFEPSETFKIAMESRIRKAIYGLEGIEGWAIYVIIIAVVLSLGLSLMNYLNLVEIVDALKEVGVIKNG